MLFNKSGKNILDKKGKPIPYKELMVDSSNYKVDNGFDVKTGGFSRIYVVKDKEGKVYAAKVLTNFDKKELKSQLVQEIDNLILCQHPAIIKFYGYSSKDIFQENNYTIYMDYAKKGSLADYIDKEKSPEKLTNTALQIILVGIAYGMMTIHKKGILHLDLKPHNILLDENFHPLIADFGISEKIKPNTLNTTFKGTSSYMAPEILREEPYNEKVDVYSFGILMYEVVSRKFAYPDLKNGKIKSFQLTTKVIEGLRPKFKHNTNKWIKNLIKRCWDDNPKERPDFREIFVRLTENNEQFNFDIVEDFEKNIEDSKDEYDSDEECEDKIDDKEEEEDYINLRYHLKNVDVDELRAYVKSISIDDDENSAGISNNLRISGVQRDDPRRYIQNFEKEKEYLHNEEWRLKYEQLEREFNALKNGTLQEQEENFKFCLSGYERKIEKLKKENSNYRTNLDKLNEENEELKEQLNDLQNKYQKLEKKINEKTDQLLNLEKNKRLEAEKVNPILREKYDLINLNEEKQNQINNLEIQNQSLNSKLEKYKSKNASLLKENLNLKDQIDDSKFSHDDNLTLINDLKRDIEKLEQSKIKSMSMINEKSKEINNLRGKIAENEILINTLIGENGLLTAENEEKTTRIKNLQQISQSNLDLENKTRTYVQSQENLKKQLENLEKENQIIKDQLSKNKRPKSQIMHSKSTSSIRNNNEKEKVYRQCFINSFNSLDLRSQQISISEVHKQSSCFKLNLAISNINNFLNYLLKFDNIPDRINCLQIPSDQLCPQNLASSEFYSELNRIFIRWEATEILYQNICFNDPELINLLDKFDDTIIEIKFDGQSDELIEKYNNINQLVITYLKMAKISIFITGVNETDAQRFKNNKNIDFVKIDSTVSIIKGGIVSGSFSSCSSLKKVIIPSSVKIIESSAFSCCYSLTSITIPHSVETIQSHAFNGCKNLKKVFLDNNLKSIESHVFFGCTSLTEILIPTSITSIGKQTFYNCKSLSKILIPWKINLIDEEAFFNCISLNMIKFVSPEGENKKNAVNLIIEKNAFKSCESIEQLTFPSHLDKIAVSAFSDCTNLKAIKFVSAVNLIGKNAFSNCPVIEATFPKEIEKMFSRSKIKEYGIKTKVEVYPE